MIVREAILVAALLSIPFTSWSGPEWQDSTLVKVETINGWCQHCGSDFVKMNYSFKLGDGTTYVGQIGAGGALHHRHPLDVTLNAHIKFRFEKDGHVGDYVHILDDSGKDKKLLIIGKEAPSTTTESSRLRLDSLSYDVNGAWPRRSELRVPAS